MKNLLVFLLVLFITTLGLDTFLKCSMICPPTVKYYDSAYGALNRPNIEYVKFKEGFFMGTSTRDGRWKDTCSADSDSNKLNILMIGDSFVEGIDVLSRHHFSSILSSNLARKTKRKIQILNFGRGNCILNASSYYYLNHIVPNYRADVVLYFVENRDIAPWQGSYPSTAYGMDSNNKILSVDTSWKLSGAFKLHQRLIANGITASYENWGFARLAYRAFMSITNLFSFGELTLGKFYPINTKAQTYETSVNNDTLSKLSKLLLKNIAQSYGGKVVFVVRNTPVKAASLMGYFETNKYDFINLSDTLNNDLKIENTNIDAHFFKTTKSYGGHWNHEGHKAVGQLLSDRLDQLIKTRNDKK